MGIKQKLGLGVASAALGLSLLGGGTYAYFSDTAEAAGTFTAGKLDLSVEPTEIIKLEKFAPGDKEVKEFNLINGGNVNISTVELATKYEVTAGAENNNDDFGKHIKVNFLVNVDKNTNPFGWEKENVIWETTLYDLQSMTPDAVANKLNTIFDENKGLKAGDTDKLVVGFEFDDNGQDQNQFQGDTLELTWTFTGKQ